MHRSSTGFSIGNGKRRCRVRRWQPLRMKEALVPVKADIHKKVVRFLSDIGYVSDRYVLLAWHLLKGSSAAAVFFKTVAAALQCFGTKELPESARTISKGGDIGVKMPQWLDVSKGSDPFHTYHGKRK